VTSPIAPCSGCGLSGELCRCLEEQAAVCALWVNPELNSLKTARVQAYSAARERLAARRAARNPGVEGSSTGTPQGDI
jgi:hypothetical protein